MPNSYMQTMGLVAFGLFLLLPGVLMFKQNQYKVIFERMEVVSYNKAYVGYARTHNFKYNRTQAAVNQTLRLMIDLKNVVKMEVQAYKFLSNEYRFFAIRFMFDYCEYATKNEFGIGEMLRCGNFTNACYLKKGLYHLCNWYPNGDKFPPNAPRGRYMFDLKFFVRSTEILFYQVYFEIKYPEVK